MRMKDYTKIHAAKSGQDNKVVAYKCRQIFSSVNQQVEINLSCRLNRCTAA